MSVAVPDFWNYDINFKNEKLDIHIPNTVEEDVQREKFTLPVLYIYSYDIDKLIPYWEWSADGPVMPLREENKHLAVKVKEMIDKAKADFPLCL